MAYERIKASALPQALSDVVADVADLLQREIKLARVELSAKLSSRLHAGVWMLLAALLGLIALLALVEGVILYIATLGVALHWASMIVAGGLAVIAALFFLRGRADARETVLPTHTAQQIQKDIATAKEHLA
jgi:uncharacterized membrane protein YqjE